jgi:hypothetical protein
MISSPLGDVASNWSRSCEVALLNCLVRYDSLEAARSVLWPVLNIIDDPRREPCFLEQLCYQEVRPGAYLRALRWELVIH